MVSVHLQMRVVKYEDERRARGRFGNLPYSSTGKARRRLSKFLTVERIEFIVTYRCNSHCKHCQIGQDKRASQPVAIDKGLAVQIVHEVAEAYSPSSIMTFGGEPLLFPDIVCAIQAAARASGIGERQVITNAGWPRSAAEFRTVARQLADRG